MVGREQADKTSAGTSPATPLPGPEQPEGTPEAPESEGRAAAGFTGDGRFRSAQINRAWAAAKRADIYKQAFGGGLVVMRCPVCGKGTEKEHRSEVAARRELATHILREHEGGG